MVHAGTADTAPAVAAEDSTTSEAAAQEPADSDQQPGDAAAMERELAVIAAISHEDSAFEVRAAGSEESCLPGAKTTSRREPNSPRSAKQPER